MAPVQWAGAFVPYACRWDGGCWCAVPPLPLLGGPLALRERVRVPPSASCPGTSGVQALNVVRVSGDALPELLVCPLHLRMVAVNMLAGLLEQFLVGFGLKTVPARTINGSHDHSFLDYRPTIRNGGDFR